MHEHIPVKAVMKTRFDLIDRLTTVARALQEMVHEETKTLIVNKRDAHDEYGLVTMRDIATKVLAANRAPERVNVYEIMTKPIITVHQDMDIRYCARLFEQTGLSRAPVLNDAREIIGLVSLTDLVLKGLKPQLTED